MDKTIIEFLCENGCVKDMSGHIHTACGDYVTYTKLDSDPIANLIYKHKLTELQFISSAKGEGCGGAVGIGLATTSKNGMGSHTVVSDLLELDLKLSLNTQLRHTCLKSLNVKHLKIVSKLQLR